VLVHLITIIDVFTLAHKSSLKEPPPSDWLALTSSNWIASAGKHRMARPHHDNRWREAVQEAEMRDKLADASRNMRILNIVNYHFLMEMS
jgi:hypothetical protein